MDYEILLAHDTDLHKVTALMINPLVVVNRNDLFLD